jgi:hypothetical protein
MKVRFRFRFRINKSTSKILIQLSIFLIFIFTLLYVPWEYFYIRYYEYVYLDKDFIFNKFKHVKSNLSKNNEIILDSKCKCKLDEKLIIKLTQNDVYTILNNKTKFEYEIERFDFEQSIFTCNLYNVLRRGPKTKVISFSLYGKNDFYYRFLKDLIKIIHKLYPNWLIRIYYDSTIDESVICDLECYKNEDDNNYFDIVDLCDIEQMPIYLSKYTWNASYMHGMTWRWLPLGDSFVDYFSSRDTDAWMSKREVDSVNVWLKSNTLFHVMRGFY